MFLNKSWHDSIYLHTIIEKGYAALSINAYPGYIFNPIPSVEGIGIQERSLCMTAYALGIPFWGTFGLADLTSGVQAPFSSAVPFFHFKWMAFLDAFSNGHLQIKCSGLLQW